MKTLELNQMEKLQGGVEPSAVACGFAIGVGLAAIGVMGPWGLVIAMTAFCSNELN